jgi:uncharacterized membrane protein
MPKSKFQLVSVIISSLCSCIFAFIKFNPCRLSDFSSASVTLNACYSDIPMFWKSRLLEVHLWPYSYLPIPELSEIIPPIEYPVIVGTIIWLLSFITPQQGIVDVNYFDVNSIFIVLLFTATNFYLFKLIKNKVFFFLFAPAVFFSLFINWDMWAVLPTIMAIYYFDRKQYKASGVLLAIATAAKFYPIVLLLPIVCILFRRGRAKMGQYLVVFFGFYSLINLPYVLSDFAGWNYFFEFSFNRGIGYGSIWEATGLLGLSITNLNLFYTLTTIVVFALVTTYYLKYADLENLYSIAFFSVFAFTVFSKVYSPQYVLWLTPLAVLALRNQRQINFYFIWQTFELIYHFAIWRYIYWLGLGDKIEGLVPEQYSIISLLRMFSLILFTLSLAYPHIRKTNKLS